MLKISTDKTSFVDSEGRERIFNGVNLCDKGKSVKGSPHRIYNFDFSEDTIKALAENGFNIVRLGMTWDAVEPEPGQYDEEYLDRVEKVADHCEKYGIYFYLDMHQDLYSGRYETDGDGAPYWACLTDGAEFKKAKFVWAEGYFWGKAVHRSFDAFWNNECYNGVPLQEYFCRMWMHIAERFKDHPALFGYDFLNEPFPGSAGGKVFAKLIAGVAKTVITDKRCNIPSLAKTLFSGNVIGCLEPFDDYSLFRKATKGADKLIYEFDTKYYSPFINRVASAVRRVTDNGIIIMENSYYSNLGIPYSTPVAAVGGKEDSKVCFAPHAYDFMVDTPAYKYASNTRVGGIFDEHKNSQNRLGIPLLVGEWGGQSEGTDWLYHIEYLLDKFDGNHWGQTYWAYFDGMLESPVMSCLRRTAPVAVTGKIDSYSFDRENNIFTLKYTQDKKYNSKTEIYLHSAAKKVECNAKYEIIGDRLFIDSDVGVNEVKIYYLTSNI